MRKCTVLFFIAGVDTHDRAYLQSTQKKTGSFQNRFLDNNK
jgi:hypothetical protein